MIKFQYIIHKETATVIKYEDWLREHNFSGTIRFCTNLSSGSWNFDTQDMLFSDDFEIIYDSEFTTDELKEIFKGVHKKNDVIMQKIHKNINDREFHESKYGIDI